MSVSSRLHEAEEENPLVPLALGAIATLDALERAVSRADDAIAAEHAPHGATLASDDPLVLATLGLLGLGRTLRGWLATAAGATSEPHATVTGCARDVATGPRSMLDSGSLTR